ncbi:MAG: hypothetical protein KDA41_04180, partial [Planctomycetales bacterium]|nr:hypothetical protein [Planctomycetales bacterium]
APYTQDPQGVVLRTHDGGRRWTILPAATLPALKRVSFQSPARGWAVGLPSTMYPGGIFTTSDGGRSWLPVNGVRPAQWLCADFRDAHSGAVAGRDGAMAVATINGTIASRTPSIGLRAARDLQLVGETGGWLVGDGGLVMTTEDGGLSWQLPAAPIPTAVRQQFDLTAVAVVGSHVWAVGSPGTLALHSPDGGRHWAAHPTGQSLPLCDVHFVDAQVGYAVGSLGTILATRDGGQSWRRQRAGGGRAALLAIVADESSIPRELLAELAANEGYLSVVEVVGRRDIETPSLARAPADDRARAATALVGGSAARQAWDFPLRDKDLPLGALLVARGWDEAHDGRGLAALDETLVRKIRQWRPDVVLTEFGGDEKLAGAEHLIRRAVLQAVERAADSTAFPQQ